jgi:PAS domain-containing protein
MPFLSASAGWPRNDMNIAPIERFLPREDATLRSLIAHLADIAVQLTLDGSVVHAFARRGHAAEDIVGSWVGGAFRDTLTKESKLKLDRALASISFDTDQSVELEINHKIGDAFGLPVLYRLYFRAAARTALLIGRDLQDVARAQQRLMAATVRAEMAAQRGRNFGSTLAAVLDIVPDPIFVLNEDMGEVEASNPAADRLLGRHIGASTFSLGEVATIEGRELIVKPGRRGSFPIETLRFRRGANSMMIVLIRSVEPKAALRAEHAFDEASVAIAVTDADGRIVSTNAALLRLSKVDRTAQALREGGSIADILVRGTIDMQVVLASVQNDAKVSDHEVLLKSRDTSISAILTAFRLADGARSQIVWMFRPSDSASGRDDMSRMLTAKVGRMSLLEIVAESNVEIERLCIEEALRRTGDNRAAAANLLGLSRQSLYVRLRRFGIESKFSD